MSLANLKKSRNDFMKKLNDEITKINNPETETKNYSDDRIWKAEVDKSGNGYAVIRFLPPVDGEDVPWARVFNHGFQGPTGQWYIENSLTTLGKKDPVSEYNRTLWNSGIEANKEIARKQKRRLSYYSNVYIVSDPKNPQNEGKVFLYKYGKKIFDKINDLMNPEFEDETPVNPFDFWEGANFKLKIRKVEGFQNYDKSEFEKPSQLVEDETELETIWKTQYKLSEFTDEENFKGFEELQERLNTVLGLDSPKVTQMYKTAEPTTTPTQKPTTAEDYTGETTGEETDEEMSYFAKLANE
tara:strand:- start:1226 stop:2122 length:897 start_codon:yes stop_codon:yes gene_type:complete